MQKQKILLIVAAGSASRMGYAPKAASLVNGVPNLRNTVEKAYPHFDRIVVISNGEYHSTYSEIVKDYKEKTDVRVILSGRGCGHAVLESLKIIKDVDADVVVSWGDAYFDTEEIFSEILSIDAMDSPLLIPVVKEEDPYVWFEFKDNLVKTARFSKFGEKTMSGYHDQSIFRLNKTTMLWALQMMHNVLEKDGKYTGEMVFLNVCHFLYNVEMPARSYVTTHSTLAYNTESELEEVNAAVQSLQA